MLIILSLPLHFHLAYVLEVLEVDQYLLFYEYLKTNYVSGQS